MRPRLYGLVFLAILVAFSASAQGNPERDAYYGETHIRALIVGKSTWLQNNVTDDKFLIAWNEDVKGGKIVARVGDAPFETAVYKLGDKHYAARSNEFGYASYELIPVPAQLGTEVHFNLTK